MALTVAVTLFVYLIWCTSSSSAQGSGGSGMVNRPPVLTGCPVGGPLNRTLTRPINPQTPTHVNISGTILPSVSDPEDHSYTVSASIYPQLLPASVNNMLTSGAVVVISTLPESGEYLLITVTGNLVLVDSIVVEVSITATDSLMAVSAACNFTVEITVENPVNCTGIQGPGIEVSTIIQAVRAVYSISMTLNIPFANFTAMREVFEMQIQMVIADGMNTRCIRDCGSCSMGPSCQMYLQDCVEFAIENVIFSDDPRPGLPRDSSGLGIPLVSRDLTGTTVVSFFVALPTGAPATNPLPLVSASTSQEVVVQTMSLIESITGIPVVGVEPLVSSPNIISPLLIAQIVAPILVILLVSILVVGIIIILVIVHIKKVKKRSKVTPASNDIDSSHQNNNGKSLL